VTVKTSELLFSTSSSLLPAPEGSTIRCTRLSRVFPLRGVSRCSAPLSHRSLGSGFAIPAQCYNPGQFGDLLFCDGEDLRYLPLEDRKHRLRSILPPRGERLHFQLACERDLEGIVAKRKFDPYLPGSATWLKIRNPKYSQWIGREELFERERSGDPDWQSWNVCTSACDELIEAHGQNL
jgi:hypothetical protein